MVCAEEKLFTRDPFGNRKEIQQIEPTTARRTLGVWQAANGSEDKQVRVLTEKLNTWRVTTTGISRNEAALAIKTTIGRSIRYPLTATALNYNQAMTVDKMMRKCVLNKMGVVRTAPNEEVFLPKKLGV